MGVWLIRAMFVVFFTAAGYSMGVGVAPLIYALFGFVVGAGVVAFEISAHKMSLKNISSAVFGILLGLAMAKLTGELLKMLLKLDLETMRNMNTFITIFWVYFGLTLGLRGKSDFNVVIPYVRFKRQDVKEERIIVDTSSIIDGRILDIMKTGFLEVKLAVPKFVLKELHALADSTDHMKRQKGKRGIEILHSLSSEAKAEVEVVDEDYEGSGVDEKLVKMATATGAKILTTDYNLNRVAQLQGINILNINDLANALKPSFIAGERFNLKLIKEGKEHNQAIGYLEDGTMVVVENAKGLIGKVIEIEVTSILQSPSGRIVFTKLAG